VHPCAVAACGVAKARFWGLAVRIDARTAADAGRATAIGGGSGRCTSSYKFGIESSGQIWRSRSARRQLQISVFGI
jgi:hypothetical protein